MSPNTTHKKLIVLIEDEEIITDLLTKSLETAGFIVKHASDGNHGLELIEKFEPDLVLLDMMLPKLDGFGVLDRLYRDRKIPGLPVIIISNSGQPIEIERAQKLGIKDYLIKVNFSPKEVIAKIQFVLEADMAAETEGIPTQMSGKKIKVLIVEDDLFLIQLLENKFAKQPYEVYKAVDVEGARKILTETSIDVILLDIVLPGTDGFTFLKELKAHQTWRSIPVIIMSNLGQEEEVKLGIKGGAVDYIIKAHANPQEIVKKINSVSGIS